MSVDLPGPRSLVADASWEDLRRDLEEGGAAVYELDFSEIVDARSFLEHAGQELPADPAKPFTKWSALEDALWAGLTAQPARTVVYGWRHVDHLLDQGLATLLQALDVANDLCRLGLDPETGGLDEALELFLVITGEGRNFPSDPVA